MKKRYHAVARTLSPFGVTRGRAAEMIHRSRRQLQRLVKRFREEGIPGLRFRSKRPHTTPRNKTPPDVEMLDRKALGLNGRGSQKVVPASEVRAMVEQGWEYVSQLPDGYTIVRLPRTAGGA